MGNGNSNSNGSGTASRSAEVAASFGQPRAVYSNKSCTRKAQSDFDARMFEDTVLNRYLDQLSRRGGGKAELDRLLRFVGELGRGEYARVYKVRPRASDLRHLSLAIKEIVIPDASRGEDGGTVVVRRENRLLKQMTREVYAYAFMSEMVRLRVCPGFLTLFAAYGQVAGPDASSVVLTMVLERADDTMSHWLAKPHAPEEYVSLAYQVSASCYTMGLRFALLNNDLYPNNALFLRCSPDAAFVYRLGRRSFRVPLFGHQWVIADFGLCSSPLFLENAHETMHRFYSKLDPIDGFAEYDYSRHVLSFSGVPHYCRDLLAFFRSLTSSAVAKECAPVNWVRRCLRLLERMARDGTMDSPRGIRDFIMIAFSPEYFRRSGLPHDLLRDEYRPGDVAEVSTFDLDAPLNVARDVIPAVKDRFQFSATAATAGGGGGGRDPYAGAHARLR